MNRTAIKAGISACVVGASVLIPAQAAAEPAVPASGSELAGRTVFLDPGHQGSSAGHDLAKQVPDGRGGTKDCQTSGMTTLGGVAEHTINWNVAQLVKGSLESLGAKVVLSRADDTGWGGCVDERARAASASKADLAVSIHADSTTVGSDPVNQGFHLIVPTLPIPDAEADKAQSGGGLEASKIVRDAYLADGFAPANYVGVDNGNQTGIQTRSDVAGPALTQVPLVFVEMGNGSNPEDAAQLESTDGQVKHAIAITTGIVTYLLTGSSATQTAAAPAAGSPASSATPSSEKNTSEKNAPKTGSPEVTPIPGTPESSGTTTELSALLERLAPLLGAEGLAALQDLVNEGDLELASQVALSLLAVLTGTGQN